MIGRLSSAFVGGAHWLVWDQGSGTQQGLAASRVSPIGSVPANWPDGFSLVSPSVSQPLAVYSVIIPRGHGAVVNWLEPQPYPSTIADLWEMPIYSAGP